MASLQGFDANQVEPNAGFDPLPAGKYVCVIAASEMKPTKNGDGEYLQLEVIEGEHRGRKVWDRLLLKHPKPKTVQIARGTLSAICRAVNVLTPRDSIELHGLRLAVKVNRCMYHQPIAEVLQIDDDGDHDRFDEESGPDSLASAAREIEVTRRWDSAGRPAQRMLA